MFARSLKALNAARHVIAIGYAGGHVGGLSPALVVGRNVSVAGFYLGRLMALAPDVVARQFEELVGLWEQGAIRPVVGAELPLAEAAEAHALIEERRTSARSSLFRKVPGAVHALSLHRHTSGARH